MKSLYETENASVLALLDERMDFYVVQLVGDVQKNHYKNAWESVLRDAKKNNVCNIIFNFKDMTTQPDVGRIWFSNEFLPRFTKIHPNIRLAVISPAISIFEQTFIPIFYFIRNFFTQFFKNKTQIKVRFFKKVAQAQNWLGGPENDMQYAKKISPKKNNQHDFFDTFTFPEKNSKKTKKNKSEENEKNSFLGNLAHQILENENQQRRKKKKKNTTNQPIEPLQPKGFFGNLFSNLFFTTETQNHQKIYNIGNKKSGFSFKIYFSKKGDLSNKTK